MLCVRAGWTGLKITMSYDWNMFVWVGISMYSMYLCMYTLAPVLLSFCKSCPQAKKIKYPCPEDMNL